MRTRFLATEHSAAAVQTLGFLRLPLPDHIPLPDDSSFSVHLAHSFSEVPVFRISQDIDKLPIDDALSMFLSDVLPHFVDAADFQEQGIASSENFEVVQSEVKHAETSNIKGWNCIEFLQFEVSKMDASLLSCPKSAICSQMESLCTFSDIPDGECSMDLCHTELRLLDHLEIKKSVYSVDNMKMEYPMEQNADLLENADSVQGQHNSHNVNFPHFEVDVGSLYMVEKIYMEDLNFEVIETLQLMQLDDVIGNGKELLGSMEFDLMKYVLNQCVSIQFLEEGELSVEVDYLSILEHPIFQEHSTSHQGKRDGSVCPVNPVLFKEFQFFDLDIYHFYEVASDAAKEIEAETCESIFGEAMNFRSFDEMIVCHELTLMDESFKSLPVPILSECRLTYSLPSFLEKVLTRSDWQSSTASDGLYLDWHFLGEDDSDIVRYSSCWKTLWDIDTYNIESSVNSSDSGNLIWSYILSENLSTNELSAENHNEILSLPLCDVSMFHNSHVSSGTLDTNYVMNSGGRRRISSAGKASLFGASMSNDLDFFLDPLKFNAGRARIPEDKASNTNSMCQSVLSHDESVAANATTSVQEQWNVELHCNGDLGPPSSREEREIKLEEMLNTVPVMKIEDNQPGRGVYEGKTCTTIPVQSMQPCLESNQNDSCKPFCPDMVIIVNTQNLNDEMLISRRSTYHKILEMEKEGRHVVERDVDLPVDIIVSAKVCLNWYDSQNIGKKASAPDEAFSCLPLCVESIAASILTSLSFAFGCCILIFEGEGNFLGGIMESSDELYAAAASLGIDVQIFCSYSSEMTEEIILSCINKISKLSGGLLPKMPDSESLAESFLTTFPSINALSAHAILSSDAILGKFMEFSNEERICALQKYQVPEESVSLFSVISRYGEREDSKSGLTDCSSVSSVLDSENLQFKMASERNKPKYSPKIYRAEELSNDFLHSESLKVLPDELSPPKLSVSCSSWMNETVEIFDEPRNFNMSFDDKLRSHSQRFDVNTCKKFTDKPKPYNCLVPKGLEFSAENDNLWIPRIHMDRGPEWRSAATELNGFSVQSTKVLGSQQDNFKGEVINVDEMPEFGGTLSFANLHSFSPFLLDAEKDYAARNSRRSKLSPSADNIHVFTNPLHIDSAFDAWSPRKDGQIFVEETKPHFYNVNSDNTSLEHQKGPLKLNMIEETPIDFYKGPSRENGTLSYGGTPLSNALHSTQLQHGSPWTIEFLNRIKEKSRLRKQSLSRPSVSPCLDSTGNTSNVAKRKSPSIFESFKYESSSTSKKIGEQKRQKRSLQPPNPTKNENTLTSRPPSWTPVDKRARRVLSFATKGSGGQSKLVWKDDNSHSAKRRF